MTIMTEEDIERIKAAQRRAVMGHADAIDEWVLRRAGGSDVVGKTNDGALDISEESRIGYWNQWFAESFEEQNREWVTAFAEVLAEATAELRSSFGTKLRELELTVARLEGELKGLRGSDAIATAKLVGDAIEKPLLDYVDARLKGNAKSDIIDLPAWRKTNGTAA